MLVLSRKCEESVAIGNASGIEPPIKVTVLDIRGGKVKLGFEVKKDVPVHRWEVLERIRTEGQVSSSRGSPTAPAA